MTMLTISIKANELYISYDFSKIKYQYIAINLSKPLELRYINFISIDIFHF